MCMDAAGHIALSATLAASAQGKWLDPLDGEVWSAMRAGGPPYAQFRLLCVLSAGRKAYRCSYGTTATATRLSTRTMRS